jgi:anti-sigma B factor antagonist
MELSQRETGDGGTFIAIDGELDAATAPRLRELLVQAVEANGRHETTIDLAECTFIDSTGLGVIIEVGHLLDKRLQKLRIVNLREQPRQLFELTLVAEAPFIQVDES